VVIRNGDVLGVIALRRGGLVFIDPDAEVAGDADPNARFLEGLSLGGRDRVLGPVAESRRCAPKTSPGLQLTSRQ
jgi:hypothetical protein